MLLAKRNSVLLLFLFSGILIFHSFGSWRSLSSFHPRALSNDPQEQATTSIRVGANITTQPTNISTKRKKHKVLPKRLKSNKKAVQGAEAFVSQPAALDAMQHRKQFCLPWEVDSDVWWTHHPYWSVSFENDTHYCFEPMKDLKKADFFRKVYANQFQTDCSTVYTKTMWSSGWGADFSNVIDRLHYGIEKRVPIQMYHANGWHYAATKNGDRPVCPSKDMYCFFLNMTRCQAQPDKAHEGFANKAGAVYGQKPWDWYAEFATRPQTWLRHEVYLSTQKLANQMGLDLLREQNQTCATLHVRRADAGLPRAKRHYYSIQEYIQGITAALGRDHPKNILLLTDDQDAVEEAKRDFPQYNWMTMNRTRFRGTSGGWENHIPSGDPKEEVVVLLSTFRLIQNCHLFVQARSSFANYMWGILQEQVPRAQRLDLRSWMKKRHVVATPQTN